MKKIILSLAIVAAAGAIVVGGSIAYFSDSVSNTNNTFTTGTINIDIDDSATWSSGFDMIGMKPSQTDYINFRVNNVGTNPVNIWKKITNIINSDNGVPNEPECLASGGAWVVDGSVGNCDSNYVARSDLQYYMNYDLSVEVYTSGGNDPIWWQTIYRDVDNKTISEVYSNAGTNGILLGMIPSGGHMLVEQSYHLIDTVNNWAQNDKLTFDIQIMGEQLTNTVVLDNKVDADGAPGDVYLTQDDSMDATLTYKVKDNKFKYDFSAQGIANADYILVAGTNPWNSSDAVEIGKFTCSGNAINAPNQIVDLDQDLINAKVWLILATDWDGFAMTAWNGGSYLFETALMDYYDTDL